MGKYALLLSGGISQKQNRIRYENDLAFTYSVLSKKYNYDKDKKKFFFATAEDSSRHTNILTTKATIRIKKDRSVISIYE